MIKFKALAQEEPYLLLRDKYDEAFSERQPNIEAIAISSFNKELNEIDSRYVNLKFIQNNKFIFFSNYQSSKAIAFKSHNQIGALIFWSSTNTQIRMKARIERTSVDFNSKYFKERSKDKNALAIASQQSKEVSSYNNFVKRYKNVKETKDLLKCPDYWGGYSFTPYYFEFWKGHESRVNERTIYEKIDNKWSKYFIQP